tara:strand:+ start:291 stop:431 length:141 start_codon:yes stop_codon:yes gene_type:complete
MKKINPVTKKISKKNRRVPLTEPSKLLADFFNGVVIDPDINYPYES